MTTITQTAIRSAFQLGFQISPIILSGGVASGVPWGYLPIVSITESVNFVTGLLSGASNLTLDNFFAQFVPAVGASLVDNQIGHYPFANQTVAANAIITQPLRVAMRMITPVREANGYVKKLATMSLLKSVLAQHNAKGGTYIVVTPSCIYRDCVMVSMRDVGGSSGRQAQAEWLLEFEQPLLTLSQAAQVLSNGMSKLSNGLPWDGSTSGPGTSPGNALGGASATSIPASEGLIGTSIQGTGTYPVVPVTPEQL
jgi:hypothetical protein